MSDRAAEDAEWARLDELKDQLREIIAQRRQRLVDHAKQLGFDVDTYEDVVALTDAAERRRQFQAIDGGAA